MSTPEAPQGIDGDRTSGGSRCQTPGPPFSAAGRVMMSALSGESMVGGRYALVERIASGGMGEVWRATDQRLRRAVAVKVLRSEFARDGLTRQRFRVEAQAAASLTSSGIASVYDYGEEADGDGTLHAYIVMELVLGESLEERLHREGLLGTAETLSIVAQVASALQEAHDRDLVHRDIKPANLLIRDDGVVKLTDFGIVRVLDSTSLTQTGVLVGTVRYMSPEQLSGGTATPASDIYALGIVAYRCLAGHAPFDHDESMAVALAHVNDPLPPLPPDLPSPVAELIAQMLAKDPRRRPATAAEVALRAAALTGPASGPASLPATRADRVMSPAPSVARAGDETRHMDRRTSPLPTLTPSTVIDRGPTATMAKPGASDGPREGPRDRRWWVLASIILVVLASVTASILVLVSGPGRASVPSLTGLTAGAARAKLAQVGLRAEGHLVDVNAPTGHVVSQVPGAGRSVPSGSGVVLEIASGYVTVNGVSLDGQPAARAVTVLSSLGLRSVQTTTISTVTPGTVVSVSPVGRVRVGTSVAITIAVAPPPPTTTTTSPPTTSPNPPAHGKHGKGNDT